MGLSMMSMTSKELSDIFKNDKFKLKGYRKYSFSFENEGKSRVIIYIGGDSESISKLELSVEEIYSIDDLIKMGINSVYFLHGDKVLSVVLFEDR